MSTIPTPNERDREVAANVILNLSTIWGAAVSPNLDNDMVARFIASYRAEIEAGCFKTSEKAILFAIKVAGERKKRISTLEKALSEAEKLVKRMKEVYNDPHYLLVWTSYQNHGGDYSNGPTWVDEFEALDASIRKAKGQA